MTSLFKALSFGSVATMGAVGMLAGSAQAGGFAPREQSAVSQGSSYAGDGAGTALSSMFWNSAAVTNQNGLNFEGSASAIFLSATETSLAGSTFGAGTSADYGRTGYLPSFYANYQFKNYDPNLYVGLGVNSPFGLVSEPNHPWAGSPLATSTSLKTYNFNPTLGYRFSDQFSVGVGAQFQQADGTLKFATAAFVNPTIPFLGGAQFGSTNSNNTLFTGSGFAVGATVGIMYTPVPATRIGLGWRSQITQQLDGNFASNGAPIPLSPALLNGAAANPLLNQGVSSRVEIRLPDIVTLSLNQAVAPGVRVLGTVEWSNWSRLGGLSVVTTGNGNSATSYNAFTNNTGAVGAGTTLATINAPWKDGWLFSGGFEYDYSKQLTLRTGFGYEIAPTNSPSDRLPGIPDSNRYWASGGFSYAVNPMTTFDFAYSHVFLDSSTLNATLVTNSTFLANNTLNAKVDANIDIVSVGLRVKFN